MMQKNVNCLKSCSCLISVFDPRPSKWYLPLHQAKFPNLPASDCCWVALAVIAVIAWSECLAWPLIFSMILYTTKVFLARKQWNWWIGICMKMITYATGVLVSVWRPSHKPEVHGQLWSVHGKKICPAKKQLSQAYTNCRLWPIG